MLQAISTQHWKDANPAQGTLLIASHLDLSRKGEISTGLPASWPGWRFSHRGKRRALHQNLTSRRWRFGAEESTWFPNSYIGSKGALGLLSAEALDVRRADTGRTLAEHIDALGFKSAAVRGRVAHWKRENLKGYVELHIEQGPVLEAKALPVALVTGIRGSFRYRDASVVGRIRTFRRRTTLPPP